MGNMFREVRSNRAGKFLDRLGLCGFKLTKHSKDHLNQFGTGFSVGRNYFRNRPRPTDRDLIRLQVLDEGIEAGVLRNDVKVSRRIGSRKQANVIRNMGNPERSCRSQIS